MIVIHLLSLRINSRFYQFIWKLGDFDCAFKLPLGATLLLCRTKIFNRLTHKTSKAVCIRWIFFSWSAQFVSIRGSLGGVAFQGILRPCASNKVITRLILSSSSCRANNGNCRKSNSYLLLSGKYERQNSEINHSLRHLLVNNHPLCTHQPMATSPVPDE